jgi:2-iminoacetate synthase ThiH
MSRRELRRVGVMARVKSGELKLVDAGLLLNRSYRQVKRVWRRYQAEGAKGLKYRSAGGESNRRKPEEFREKVLRTIRKKYSGGVGKRFGPTLAAEHLESEDQLTMDAETLRRWMLEEGLGVWRGNGGRIGNGGSGKSILGNWCRWTAAFMIGSKGEGGEGV